MDFTNVLTNFSDKIAISVPNIIGALIILLIGWLIAKGVQKLIINVLKRTPLDDKVMEGSSKGVGKFLYYLILIIVFLIVLETLGIKSVLSPLESMIDKFLGFIPHLIAAGLIGVIGYLLAKIVAGLVASAGSLISKGVDKVGLKNTEKTTEQIVKVLKSFVFIVIFIPLLIQAINALQLHSVGDPLNEILDGFIDIIGNVIVAAVILTIFVWGGRLLTNFLSDLFSDLGIDDLTEKIGLNSVIGEKSSLAKLVANILYFFIIFFGVITALEILRLEQLTTIFEQILDISGSIAFGVVILVIGNFISTLIYKAMTNSKKNQFVASVVRIAVLGLFLGIGLRFMGIANEIVNLAFGLTLGAVAVVIALAYGLGGREAAGEHFKEIIQKLKGEDNK